MKDQFELAKAPKPSPSRRKTPLPPPLPPEAAARVSAAAAAAAAVQPAPPSAMKQATLKGATPGLRRVALTFDAPHAQQVSVAGDFNAWEMTTMPLTKAEKGLWKITLSLKPGHYQYKFVKDGEWLNDPNNVNLVPNQFGSLNNVMEVK